MPKAKAGGRQRMLDLSTRKRSTSHTLEPFVPTPNPRLSEFIATYATDYEFTADNYDVPAFNRDLVADNAIKPRAINDLFTYWGKKHWAAIREYIRHYVPENLYPRGTGLVLDCFSGSGMTGVAALMEERPPVLVDASPAAAFIAHSHLFPTDPDKFREACEQMLTEEYPAPLRHKLRSITGRAIGNLSEELSWLYETRCDRCAGPATTEYMVYSERFQCPGCGEVIALFDCPEVEVSYPVGKKGTKEVNKKRHICPHCLRRRGKPHRDFAISTRTKKFGPVPVLARYRCLGTCKPSSDERTRDDAKHKRKVQYFEKYDVARLDTISKAKIPHWLPDRDMIAGWETRHKRRLDLQGVNKVTDLYTRPNLWGIAACMAAASRVKDSQALKLAIIAISLGTSRMNMYVPSNWSMRNRFLRATYYLPQTSADMSVQEELAHESKVIGKAFSALVDSLPTDGLSGVVSNESALSLQLPENSMDFVFTDPAYVHKIQYGELNYVWDSWMGFADEWLRDEIVVNPYRGKGIAEWERDLRIVLSSVFRALKPGRWLSLCYHDTDSITWSVLQNVLLDVGFELGSVTVIDPKQKTIKMLIGEKVVKSDLVINCRKPRSTEAGSTNRDEIGLVSQRVRDILVEVLGQTGGQTQEHLWDIVLKRLLTRGQLAEHRFDKLLAEVASKSESGRWFLKEEFESLSENDVRNEELAGEGLTAFVRLRVIGVPAALAAEIVLHAPHLANEHLNEEAVEKYVRQNLLKGRTDAAKFQLGGRMKGVEFYDSLYFYLTRWLKGRAGGKTPRRNLADFLDEFLVRFKDGDKWLYRVPNHSEESSLKKARQTGLGRRVRQYVAFLRGEGEYPDERKPDVKTLCMWLKHCANFGLPEEGVALFEKGGLAVKLAQLQEDLRYDAEDYYAQCRRRAGRTGAAKAEEDEQESKGDEE